MGSRNRDLAAAVRRQVENIMSRDKEGIGLGLPLVKRLVELHGDRFDIASEAGVGTTARIQFPTSRVRAAAARGTAASIAYSS